MGRSWTGPGTVVCVINETACALCVRHVGCLVLAVAGSGRAGIAQFAEQVLQHQREAEASAQSANQADFSVQAGVQLPKCPNLGVLSNNGVPNEWQYMSVEEQAAHPINAIALQLVRMQQLPFSNKSAYKHSVWAAA